MGSLAARGTGHDIAGAELSLPRGCGQDELSLEDDDQLFVGVVAVKLESHCPGGHLEQRQPKRSSAGLSTEASTAPAKRRLVTLSVPARIENVRLIGRYGTHFTTTRGAVSWQPLGAGPAEADSSHQR
jgi:hypothetical protein